jgi:hypothetical protein
MMTELLLLVCLVLAGSVVALVVLLRRVEARLAHVERDLGSRHRPAPAPVEVVETNAPPVELVGASEFVITRLGSEPEDEPAPALETRLFADVVLRETVVRAAALVHGVRRGLSPENRNRIRFEMRREVKRARKSRKAEEREAIREYRARRRESQRQADAA